MTNYTDYLEKRMETEAGWGLFCCYEEITLKKARQLRKRGFEVTDSNDSNKSPRKHRIAWKDAVVKCADVHALNPDSYAYTWPQKLWIIAMQNRKLLD